MRPIGNTAEAAFLPDQGAFGIWLHTTNWPGTDRYILTADTGTELHEPGVAAAPTLVIDEKQAQRLLSSLWAQGIRPNGWGHEGQVSALKDHLADMRKLVFKDGE